METLIEFETESRCIHCNDNLAVKHDMCDKCLDTLTECPHCHKKALDGFICLECKRNFIHSSKYFYVCVEKDYYKFYNEDRGDIFTYSPLKQHGNYPDFQEWLDTLQKIEIFEIFKAIEKCQRHYAERYTIYEETIKYNF